ncbi:MAG: TIGR01777 family protein [Hydrotalea flava]|uniref:TIGR01777 family oxidoreductase n=1 Tax=Hydrotalea TaxID=1004300 RepID=UPI000945D70F|nr:MULTISPECIES: TIGR01777 family oxidoreductase [Hydrotalea]MBY0347881.1 TIGR01777 family oxidoreductase [Hydrotalea flava]NIM34289.1 TIGR01777 family protein [Hydrotalea flava]NIM37115.1 TIGR01777 family protein [Hydrotalea flava]NIN02308.1 TIGR01777 family protein [Hydrotalea flava]NIN13960.1 TIGR01777 family protein [Hydrotalea flava]
MKTVVITGGTGMVGKHLTAMLLNNGYQVIVLSRNPPGNSHHKALSYAKWDVENQLIDVEALASADAIVHLAGAGVADKRWSAKRKLAIQESRIKSSALLVDSLQTMNNFKVKTIVSASAIGWYGPDNDESKINGFIESTPPAKDFLGETCRLWEESITPVSNLGIRLVKYRIGIVLSNAGGALQAFRQPLRGGIATILGSGNQMISWIHIDDLCRLFMNALENNQLNGVYNAVANQPVTNRKLTLTLAKIQRGKWFIPVYVPSFLLKIIMGEMSIEVLKSTTVNNTKIRTAGFTFLYPEIEHALQQLKASE